MSVSVILAGAVWPEAAAVQTLSARVAAACPGAELIEARESRQAPRGAAAIIDDAIRRAAGDVVLVLEPWAPLDVAALRALAEAGAAAFAIEAAPDVATPSAVAPSPIDLVEGLAAADAEPDVDVRPMPAWALPRAAVTAAGGFDAAWWSVGLLEDLRSRLAPLPVRVVPTGATGPRRSAWPLDPVVQRFLRRRNRILTAFRSWSADRLGVELARVAVEALREATAASGLTGDQFRFGGGWGAAEGALARLLRPGADGASSLADHVDTVVPLLALDSALHELPRLLATRRPGSEPATEPEPMAQPEAQPEAQPGVQAPVASPELPSASVIVVSWNGKDHLGPCLASLAASDYPADRLEILVVDNGSTDGTVRGDPCRSS